MKKGAADLRQLEKEVARQTAAVFEMGPVELQSTHPATAAATTTAGPGNAASVGGGQKSNDKGGGDKGNEEV